MAGPLDWFRTWFRPERRGAAPAAEPLAFQVARALGEYSTTVVDVGARGGMDQVWYRIPPLARLVGFEADPVECARLNEVAQRQGHTHHRYVPLALGDRSGPATLHRTADPACSSLYPPDPAMADRHPELRVIRPAGTCEVQLTTLADWAAAEGIDEIAFLKLDVQGAELDILRGAGPALDITLGVEVEVEFQPIYRGQPLFADVDTFLRGRGFSLWRLDHLAHYSEHPGRRLSRTGCAFFDSRAVTFASGSGRLTWANAVYFRDYRAPGMPPRQLLLLAALFDALGDEDAAAWCLERCPSKFRTAA